MWHSAAEVAQSGAAMWHYNSDWVLNWRTFLSPNYTQKGLCPQVVPREACDQISALDKFI
jgi:hypothetical protein